MKFATAWIVVAGLACFPAQAEEPPTADPDTGTASDIVPLDQIRVPAPAASETPANTKLPDELTWREFPTDKRRSAFYEYWTAGQHVSSTNLPAARRPPDPETAAKLSAAAAADSGAVDSAGKSAGEAEETAKDKAKKSDTQRR